MTNTTAIVLTGYQIQETIYQGTRTKVYRGIRTCDQQPVIIKVLRNPHPNFNELVQFRNQYIITSHLKHSGIVQPIALELYGNGYALVMQDEAAIALSKYWQDYNASLSEFLNIAIQLAEILHYLNIEGIVHKDIKPANILICPQTHTVKLIDFSLSSLLPKQQQQPIDPNILEGTLAYISPEQTGRMNRGIDYRTDFYSLGVTFYELLTGVLPFDTNDPMELVHCHIAQAPLSPHTFTDSKGKNYSEVISNIVMKLMAKNAENRYQSAMGLKHDLEQALQQLETTGEITPFEIGQQDRCDRFLIPEKLYGREAEVQTLLSAFERVASPPTDDVRKEGAEGGGIEMMLVAGFSGIGKTAVVNEVHKPIVRQRGYFIKGKFDQFNRNIPFSAFVQAFRDLMGQLLGESDAALKKWKTKILQELGGNGQVIIEVIPELKEIIGPQPAAPELSGTAAQNRFNLLFQNFIKVFATKDHPLVIFLDDLQWADGASLTMIKVLMTEREIGYLLLLGAYRDNEVFPAHPLILTLSEIEKQCHPVDVRSAKQSSSKENQAVISTITLKPLTEPQINELVADTLSCSMKIAEPLTELIYQKTQGNPFFTTQFLKGLYEDKLIEFDLDLGYWSCELGQVREAALTDDVVEFMAGRLVLLPDITQQALKLSACISNQFDLETLAVISEISAEQVADRLWPALQEGLILPVSESYKFFQGKEKKVASPQTVSVGYRFLHDRVQQAAYSLIPEAEKQTTHLKIGQLLLRNTGQEQQAEKIFNIVNQLNQGIELISDRSELKQLAELNCIAGQKATLSTAYQAASNYFNTSIKLLGENPWSHQYDFTLKLYQEFAESQYLNGNFAEAEKTAYYIIDKAQKTYEKAKSYNLLVIQYTANSQFKKAIEVGREGLNILKVNLPSQNVEQAIENEQSLVQEELKNCDIFSLLDRSEIESQEIKEAVKLLITMQPPAYFSDSECWQLLVVKCANLLVNHGNSPDSGYGYTIYGLFLNVVLKQYRIGYEFGQIGIQLIDKFHNLSQKCRGLCVFSTFLSPWIESASIGKSLALEGYQAGLDSGNLQWAGYNLAYRLFTMLFTGDNLQDIWQDVETCLVFGQKHQDQVVIDMAETCKNIIGQLRGERFDQADLELDEVSEAKYLESITSVPQYLIFKSQLECLKEQPERSLRYAVQAKEMIAMVGGHVMIATHNFYYSLSLTTLYQKASAAEKETYWEQLVANQNQMTIWVDHCSENFTHKYLLVAAEMARLSEDYLKAIELYDRAIRSAKENKFIQNEALANELAAKFYLDWDKQKIARSYLTDAYYCYARWGAKAKTNQLEATYPQMLSLILQQLPPKLRHPLQISSETISSVSSSTSWIDLASAIKASQAISQEISLDVLLSKLMDIIAENAGADRIALILNNSGSWEIAGWCDRGTYNLSGELLDQSNNIPHSIINTVRRTEKTLLLNTVQKDNTFSADPYFNEQQPLSLCCTPIRHQGQLVGLLYLENNLTADAFTQNRIEVLNLLTAQAAISIQNARLYHRLENYTHDLQAEVDERTEQLQENNQQLQETLQQLQETFQRLQRTQAQLIQTEKMSSLGQMVAGIAHEINNPITFISGNIAHAREYVQDLLDLIDLYEQTSYEVSPAVREKLEEIDLAFVYTDLEKLFESMTKGSDRIRNIVLGLRNFSRLDQSEMKPVNLHEGLDNTLMILQHRLKTESWEIQVQKNYGKLPRVNCYASQLNQVFLHILSNAIDVLSTSETPESPAIRITTEIGDRQMAKISIADNGSGMSETVRQKVFDPFFTTKPVGRGTGLGLTTSYQIVTEQHRGQLQCISQLGQGTEFIIEIPI